MANTHIVMGGFSILLVCLIMLLFKRVRILLGALFEENADTVILVPILLTFLYGYLIIFTDGRKLSALIFPVYLFIPVFLIYLKRIGSVVSYWVHIFIIGLLWLGIDFRIVMPGIFPQEYIIATPAAAILVVMLYGIFTKEVDIKYNALIRAEDIKKTCAMFIFLAGILIPLALQLDFIRFNFFEKEFEPNGAFQLLGVIFATALPEELLFRGLLQNFFEKIFKSPWTAIVFASVLFGIGHLNNGATGLHPLLWNWHYMCLATIAGVGYGIIFKHTKSIWNVVLLHASVDITHAVFFS